MVLDLPAINKHLELLRGYVADIIEMKREVTLDELKKDKHKQYQILFPLQVAIQSCIDIAMHFIAELSLKRPETNSEIFFILSQEKIVLKDLAERMTAMVKFRNLLVHIYWKIDLDKVYAILQDGLDDFTKFEKAVVRFLESKDKL
ncbi:MAG: DUF86 domain-containing protein [Candidatus Omnitrophota bacterium]